MAKAGGESLVRFYVPEVHDIHPGMEDELDALLDIWPEEVRPRLALLIVPNWQNHFPLDAAKPFARRVAKLPGEKVLHGWTHSLGPDFWNWLMYGHDNRSEFARLGTGEARSRISAGIAAFETHFGSKPRWFCAPRWHQSHAVTEALRDAGFAGYMLRGSLRPFSGAVARLPSLCFDEGDRRLRSAVARNMREMTIARLFSGGRPFRITLHPNDVRDAAAWRQVQRVIARLADEGWTPLSLDEAVSMLGSTLSSGAEGAMTAQ
jgi:predicted deacetylase